jgi:hypothetical protein
MQHDAIASFDTPRRKASRDMLGFVSKPPTSPHVFLKDESRAFWPGLYALHQRIGKDRHWNLLWALGDSKPDRVRLPRDFISGGKRLQL